MQRADEIDLYKVCFAESDDLDISGVTGGSPESLRSGVLEAVPDVVLLGVEILKTDTVEKMKVIQKTDPKVATVLLFESYDPKGIEALRVFSRRASAGYAYLLGDTVTTMEQLGRMLSLAAAGHKIVDPELLDVLMAPPESNSTLFMLTPREMEKLQKVADRLYGKPKD